VTINANGTGSVTLVVAATGTDTITIVGDRAIQRATDFVTGGDLFANTLNDEFDSLVIFAQQVDEKADRGLKAPVTDPTDVNMVLPVKASRASKYLAFDSNGNPVATSGTGTTVVSSVMEPVVSAATLSDARTNLGLASGATTTVGTMATQASSAVAITGGTIANVNLENTFGFKNRIINGGMVIDQRNAGASVTPSANPTYTLDRWNLTFSQGSKFSIQQTPSATETGFATRVNAGFTNYLGATVVSSVSIATGDYFAIQQLIEGLNVSDLAWGTANAKTITLSFWVRSSLTGTFGGALSNSAGDRSYPFSYTISSANTWEQKSVTIAGDTSGTWLTTNGVGIYLRFGLGAGATFSGTAGSWAAANYFSATSAVSVVGTGSATFYITGVQLEKGSTATSFDYRPYGTELYLCQRYYEKTFPVETAPATQTGLFTSAIYGYVAVGDSVAASDGWLYKVEKRVIPTLTTYNPSSSQNNANMRNDADTNNATITVSRIGRTSTLLYGGGGSAQNFYIVHASASSEL
jgi:hypothetical protein